MAGLRIRVGLDASMLTERRSGVGNYVFNLLSEVAQLESGVSFYLYSDRKVAKDCQHFGGVIEEIGPPVRKGPLWMSSGLLPYLRRDAIDVFWGGNGYLPLVRPRDVRTVVTVHDFVYRIAPRTMPFVSRWSRRLLQPLAIRSASAVVAVSKVTADELFMCHGRRPSAVIHPRMDPTFLVATSDETVARVRAKYGLPERFLFTLGTLEPRKNLVSLLIAHEQVRRACGEAMPPLILAGNPGWMDEPVRRQIQRLESEGCARWLGFVAQEDMPSLFAACEFFVFVPIYEGFGMPVREALLAGARVLASDIASLREAGGDSATYVDCHTDAIRAALQEYVVRGDAYPPKQPFNLGTHQMGSPGEFLDLLASLYARGVRVPA